MIVLCSVATETHADKYNAMTNHSQLRVRMTPPYPYPKWGPSDPGLASIVALLPEICWECAAGRLGRPVARGRQKEWVGGRQV